MQIVPIENFDRPPFARVEKPETRPLITKTAAFGLVVKLVFAPSRHYHGHIDD